MIRKLTKIFEFREQLQSNANKGQYYLRVDLADLLNFDEHLAMTLRTYPGELIPIVKIFFS